MADSETMQDDLRAMVKRLLQNIGLNYKLPERDLGFLKNMQTWQGEYPAKQVERIEDIYWSYY